MTHTRQQMSREKERRNALVREPFPRDRKLAQLMPNHVLRHRHRHVVLPVVYKEPKSVVGLSVIGWCMRDTLMGRVNAPNEVGKDGARPSLRADCNVVFECVLEVRERNKERPCAVYLHHCSRPC